jgi:hypothetical protein
MKSGSTTYTVYLKLNCVGKVIYEVNREREKDCSPKLKVLHSVEAQQKRMNTEASEETGDMKLSERTFQEEGSGQIFLHV